MENIAFALFSFFLGAIPSGFFVAKAYGIDIRKQGSGNIGATNVKRILGKKAGIITLIADLLKGLAPVVISDQLQLPGNYYLTPFFGFLAIAGHCYSPFLKFKGGKGIATSLGVFLYLTPIPTLLAVATFIVTVKISSYVSLGSILSGMALPIFIFLNLGNVYPQETLIASVLTTLMTIWRHRENIQRLVKGEELKSKL